MKYASQRPCPILYNPSDEKYAESIRNFQGCPTLAVTPGGRIYLGWYSGGTREPHMDNYNLLMYSDDQGKKLDRAAFGDSKQSGNVRTCP